MQTTNSRRFYAFTLIEMLTVVAIIGVIAGLLLPAIGNAREKSRRIACASNLHQIGIAMLLYAGDHQNHIPTVENNANDPPTNNWYNALINGGYATPKVFQCPDDKRQTVLGTPPSYFDRRTPRSYAIVVADSSPDTDFWIAGSRLTCPYLTNTEVAVVVEYYNGPDNTLIETPDGNWIRGPSWPKRPNSKHLSSSPMAGNYLFLDGHVEWLERLSSVWVTGSREDQMFPKLRSWSPRLPTPPCP
jgi:prepilin-type N-terminal cleavage/methylation domain-containing protein/prepilin-type processing-associated H-X9-DG protein